jgi:2-phosphosulfolactate phosphatase
LCAGTDGHPTGEDILMAGAIVDRLCTLPGAKWHLNDVAATARQEWQWLVETAKAESRSVSEQLAIELRDTAGGHNLIEIGLDQDVVDCAEIDRLDIAPKLDVRAWRITAK